MVLYALAYRFKNHFQSSSLPRVFYQKPKHKAHLSVVKKNHDHIGVLISQALIILKRHDHMHVNKIFIAEQVFDKLTSEINGPLCACL